MCEDSGMRINKGSVRSGRIRSIRMRMRRNAALLRQGGNSSDSDDSQPGSPAIAEHGGIVAEPRERSLPEAVVRPPAAPAPARAPAPDPVPHRAPCAGPCCEAVRQRRREGLMDIALRTVNLMRSNRELQRRLHALQVETRDYIKAVMFDRANNAAAQSATSLKSGVNQDKENKEL